MDEGHGEEDASGEAIEQRKSVLAVAALAPDFGNDAEADAEEHADEHDPFKGVKVNAFFGQRPRRLSLTFERHLFPINDAADSAGPRTTAVWQAAGHGQEGCGGVCGHR